MTGERKPLSSTRHVTSTDVAKACGVSQATVARVFSSPHLVSDTTRSLVESTAAELGYVPSAIARSLKARQTNIVGAVVPAYGEYWQGVLTAVSQQVAARGRQLLLFSFADPAEVDDVLDVVRQYRVDGILLASANISTDQLAAMRNQPVPTVAFNQPAAAGLVSSVSVDNENGAGLLAQHVVDQGCRSALYVGGVSTTSTDRARYRGASTIMGANGVALPYLEAGGYSYDAGYATAATIAADTLPDAILVGSDEVAFGLIDGLAARGVSVPDDVLVTGFDGLPQADWAGIDLTTLAQPTALLAERAVDLLLVGAADTTEEVVIDGHLRLGRTTKRQHAGEHRAADHAGNEPENDSESED